MIKIPQGIIISTLQCIGATPVDKGINIIRVDFKGMIEITNRLFNAIFFQVVLSLEIVRLRLLQVGKGILQSGV
jgi:hypothetical protein